MKTKRNPNAQCKICEKRIYKAPFVLESYGANVYCSHKCMFFDRKERSKKQCPICKESFYGKNTKQIYCSRKCSGHFTRNRTGTKLGYNKGKNPTHRKLEILKQLFNFKNCMVKGCLYDRCYDVHRLIEGKNGGQYEVGNMFAICPNHHSECHKKLIKFVKISDCELEAIDLIGSDPAG